MSKVPRVSALLSEEARRGLRRFCDEQGVSLTGLLEAAGLIADERQPFTVEDVVVRARIIDGERRQR